MVRHILADGREVDSIEGMVVPTTGPTAVVYRIVADFYKKTPSRNYSSEKGGENRCDSVNDAYLK